jgi:hypothetical protein
MRVGDRVARAEPCWRLFERCRHEEAALVPVDLEGGAEGLSPMARLLREVRQLGRRHADVGVLVPVAAQHLLVRKAEVDDADLRRQVGGLIEKRADVLLAVEVMGERGPSDHDVVGGQVLVNDLLGAVQPNDGLGELDHQVDPAQQPDLLSQGLHPPPLRSQPQEDGEPVHGRCRLGRPHAEAPLNRAARLRKVCEVLVEALHDHRLAEHEVDDRPRVGVWRVLLAARLRLPGVKLGPALVHILRAQVVVALAAAQRRERAAGGVVALQRGIAAARALRMIQRSAAAHHQRAEVDHVEDRRQTPGGPRGELTVEVDLLAEQIFRLIVRVLVQDLDRHAPGSLAGNVLLGSVNLGEASLPQQPGADKPVIQRLNEVVGDLRGQHKRPALGCERGSDNHWHDSMWSISQDLNRVTSRAPVDRGGLARG